MPVTPHRYPAEVPALSPEFNVIADGASLDVRRHIAADFTVFECDGPVTVAVRATRAFATAVVRPTRHGVAVMADADGVCFTLPGPGNWQLELPDGLPILYLYALPPTAPAPESPNVRRFAGGRVHDAGEITLRDGETCWFEPGAVVRGHIRARDARGVRVGGTGLLMGSGPWAAGDTRNENVLFANCTDVVVEDLLITALSGWTIHLAGCEDAQVLRVRQITDGPGTDGVDIVGSRRVTVADCCLHNGDDNIALKALDFTPGKEGSGWWEEHFDAPIQNVRVQGCTFYNTHGGSAMEIGYETRTASIRDVRFVDIDVLAVHQFGSVFGIHNGDRAVVEDILWKDIRVEHHYDKLIDFRVLRSRWNHDAERGFVRNITLRDIAVVSSIYNPGYTLSVIAGFDAAHPIESVRLENFRLGGVLIRNADQLDLVTRHAGNISFI